MSDHEEEHTIAEDLVVTKYKMTSEIVNSKYYFENLDLKKLNMPLWLYCKML